MAIAMVIGFGVVGLLLAGDMARVCFEDGLWVLAVSSTVMAVFIVVGMVAACIALA